MALVALSGGVALAQTAPSGRTPPRDAPLLLGGPSDRSVEAAPVDPALPSGAARWRVPRPDQKSLLRSCSTHRPVCVHVRAGKDTEAAATRALTARALAALETAYERVVFGAALPAPAPDEGAGGGDQLDWYLEGSVETAESPSEATSATTSSSGDALEGAGDAPMVALESLPSRGFDRAAAFCIGSAADIQRSATLCVAEASAARLSPAQGPGLRRAYATEVWWNVARPTAVDEAAVFHAQHAPEQPVLARRKSDLSEGNALFFAYVDRLGASVAPARSSTSALSLAATRTPAGSLRFRAEPDVADVVRSTFQEQRERVARFWDEFSRARFLTDRADGWLGWASDAGSVRRAWTVKSSSLPRNLVLPRPLFPSGSAYVVLEMDHTLNTLAFRATCEGPVSYVWSVLRFDAQDNELSSVRIPFREREPRTEQRISDLENAKKLVFVGTNLGGIDLAHPFDPDHEPFEPHTCTIYLTSQVL